MALPGSTLDLQQLLGYMEQYINEGRFKDLRQMLAELSQDELSAEICEAINKQLEKAPHSERPIYLGPSFQLVNYAVLVELLGINPVEYNVSEYLAYARAVIKGERSTGDSKIVPDALFTMARYSPFSELDWYDLLQLAIRHNLEQIAKIGLSRTTPLVEEHIKYFRQAVRQLIDTTDDRLAGDFDQLVRYLVEHDLLDPRLTAEPFELINHMRDGASLRLTLLNKNLIDRWAAALAGQR